VTAVFDQIRLVGGSVPLLFTEVQLANGPEKPMVGAAELDPESRMPAHADSPSNVVVADIGPNAWSLASTSGRQKAHRSGPSVG
jgi:hypothetical protein